MDPIQLNNLEEMVESAVEEIRRLRKENGELQELLDSTSEPEGETWREEREEVRRRVEALAGKLEGLLED